MVVAPARGRRPGALAPAVEPESTEELEACPFCEGREARTPPESLALPPRAPADSPGWRVRVVPNLYPAFERQEVVVHSPRHVRSFAELDNEDVGLVAEAWRLRAEAAREAGFAYLHALVNEGRAAGASLAHSHSQLVWLREPPPAVAAEGDAREPVAALLREAAASGLEVERTAGAAAICPPAGRVPYAVLIAAPGGGEDPFAAGALAPALLALRNVVRRLRAVAGPVPWNAWLHAGAGWHLELVPRTTVLAGVELGAGIHVNPLPPEQAAAALRGAA